MADDADACPDRAVASSAVSPLADLDLWLLFAVTLVGVGNVSSVSPAFPQVVDVFDISRVQVGWVVTAYSLPGILSAPLVGIGADRLGRKRVLVPTLFVFGVAGGACALARSFPVLLGLRAVQGLAAAPLVGLAVTIIGDRYQGRDRAAAVGYNATALNVGTAAYPAVGGALAAIAWYVPFALPLLALPVGAAVALFYSTVVPARPPATLHKTIDATPQTVPRPGSFGKGLFFKAVSARNRLAKLGSRALGVPRRKVLCPNIRANSYQPDRDGQDQ